MDEFQLSAGFYSENALAIVGGSGATVIDSSGKKYIDCVGGHGVAAVGHSNLKVAEAIQAAWRHFAFATARHPHKIREEFLEKLSKKMPFKNTKIFLSNSGAESVEAALKISRLATGQTKILAAKRSFHGRTFGALSATWRPEFRAPFEPLVPDFDFFAFNKVDSLAKKISPETGAVILEVVQGEGGIHIATKEFLDGVRKLCDENNAILIFDEVQSGICRTGKFFALENFDTKPDIVCLAKALGGGYPIGATAFRGDLFEDKNVRGVHASTFGGSVPACAAGLAVLKFCEEKSLCEEAKEKGEFLKKKLNEIDSPKVREIRGIGLMFAVEFKIPVGEVVKKLEENGVLVLPTGPRIIRLLPPLVISREEITEVVEKLKKVLK